MLLMMTIDPNISLEDFQMAQELRKQRSELSVIQDKGLQEIDIPT